jgi:hypothetical protein
MSSAPVSPTPGDDQPATSDGHHRTPAEELAFVEAEVETNPQLMKWLIIAAAVVVGLGLVVMIAVTVMT